MHRSGPYRTHDVIFEFEQLSRASEQICSLLTELDTAALTTDDHSLPEQSLEPLHLMQVLWERQLASLPDQRARGHRTTRALSLPM
jgi:hypothetical protein